MTLRFLSAACVLALVTLTSRGSVGAQEWPPRTPDGQPDIQGLWASGTGVSSLNIEPMSHLMSLGLIPKGGQALGMNRTIVIDPPDHILPYHPWARARRDAVMKDYLHPSPAQMDPQTRGWPNGVPRENFYTSHDGSVGGPIQIFQPPGAVVFFYETHHEFRIVPLDGRPPLGKDIKLWMGDSRGRWEGNTLVIDVTNHNDSTRFDVMGNFHSDEMRITERWTYVDKDTIEYRATIDDPKVYTRPWTLGVTHKRGPAGNEIMEYAGVEGETGVEEAEAIARAREAAEKAKKK